MELKQVSSAIQYSSKYSSWFYKCCSLDGIDSNFDLHSSGLFSRPLRTVPRDLTTIGTTATFMFPAFQLFGKIIIIIIIIIIIVVVIVVSWFLSFKKLNVSVSPLYKENRSTSSTIVICQ